MRLGLRIYNLQMRGHHHKEKYLKNKMKDVKSNIEAGNQMEACVKLGGCMLVILQASMVVFWSMILVVSGNERANSHNSKP